MPIEIYPIVMYFIIFWIPSIIVMLLKYQFIRRAEVVKGTIVYIKPVYRSAMYTFEVLYDDHIEKVTLKPYTLFQNYTMGQQVDLYRAMTSTGRVYKFKDYIYTVPFIFILLSGFFMLMFLVKYMQ